MVSSASSRLTAGYLLVFWLLFLSLFLVPLGWFSGNAIDACGDDPKLQFLVPENYLSNQSIYSWSSYDALSVANVPHPNYPFTALIFVLKKIGFQPGTIQKMFYGLILSLGFAFTYLFIKELLRMTGIGRKAVFWGGIAGSLAFVLSPLVTYTDWIARMSETFGVFAYPALLYFFLKAVNDKDYRYLLVGAILSSLLSFTLSVATPWLAAFLIGSLVFLGLYLLLTRENRSIVLRYGLVYILLILVLNLSWVTVLVSSALSNKTLPMISSGGIGKGLAEEGGAFVASIAVNFNPMHTFFMLPSENFVGLGSVFRKVFSYNLMYLFISLPLLAAIGLLSARGRERKVLLFLLFPAVLLGYFITVNVTDVGIKVFSFLVGHFPGFIMFRNFFGKFALAFSFFYATAIGVSLAVAFSKTRNLVLRVLLPAIIVPALVVGGRPLISGDIIGVSASAGIYEKLCPRISVTQFRALNFLKNDPGEGRVFIFPMSFAQYMSIKEANNQYYVGVPYIKVITGKDDFGGIWSFHNPVYTTLPTLVSNLVDSYDFANLQKILRLMNVKYTYLYKKVAPEHSQMFTFKYGVLGEMEPRFLNSLAQRKIRDFGDVQLYEAPYQPPGEIAAWSEVTASDDPAWLDYLIYTNFVSTEERTAVVYNPPKEK